MFNPPKFLTRFRRQKTFGDIISVFNKAKAELNTFIEQKDEQMVGLKDQQRKLAAQYDDAITERGQAASALENVCRLCGED